MELAYWHDCWEIGWLAYDWHLIGILAKGLADWHEIGKLAWDWPIGMELEDWHEIGRLAWDWLIGQRMTFGRLAMEYVDFFISFLIINILSLHFPCTWSEINTNSPYVIFFSFYIIFDPLYFHRLFVESQFLMLIIRRMTSIEEKMLLFWSLRTIPNDPQPLKECLCVRARSISIHSTIMKMNKQT